MSEDVKLLRLENERKRQQEDQAEKLEIANWLSPTYKFLEKQKLLVEISYPLGQWLLNSQVFKSWCTGRPWQLRLYGDAGAGKVCHSTMRNLA
jgi:hypothetical protein